MIQIILPLLVTISSNLIYCMENEEGINNIVIDGKTVPADKPINAFEKLASIKNIELENGRVPYLEIPFTGDMSRRNLREILDKNMQINKTYIAIVKDEENYLENSTEIKNNNNSLHSWGIKKLDNGLYFLYKTGRDYLSFKSKGYSLGESGNDFETLENLEKNNITNKKVTDIKNGDVISLADMARNGSLLIQEKRGYGDNKANSGYKNIFDEKDEEKITKKGQFTLSTKYEGLGETYTINENYQPNIDELKETPHIKKQIYLRVREDDPAKRCLFNLFATDNVNGDELLQLIKLNLPEISLFLVFDAFIKDQKDEQALKVGRIELSIMENDACVERVYFDKGNVENNGYGLSSLNALLVFFDLNSQLFPFVKEFSLFDVSKVNGKSTKGLLYKKFGFKAKEIKSADQFRPRYLTIKNND